MNCAHEGCDRPHDRQNGRGYCYDHYLIIRGTMAKVIAETPKKRVVRKPLKQAAFSGEDTRMSQISLAREPWK